MVTTGISVGAEGTSEIRHDAATGQVVLRSGRLELVVETKAGLNARSLRDLKSGRIYADRDYVWAWPGTEFAQMEGAPKVEERSDGGKSVVLKGRLGALTVQQAFTMSKGDPDAILEVITICNSSDKAIVTTGFKCGFAKGLRDGETWFPDATDVRFCPVPYRRETNGQMQDFLLREIAERGTTYGGWQEPAHPTPIWGAEAWVWSKGSNAFLLAKHNPGAMEWSLMEAEKHGAETVLRFGGAGQWKHGHPEAATRLAPGASYSFGETRLQAIGGDWKDAYYAYRRYAESRGGRTPKDYDPPVHWNELYDNKYYFKVGDLLNDHILKGKRGFSPDLYQKIKVLLNEFYSLESMKGEAAKAKEFGCEALYMDPGWDVSPSQQVWDAQRLGSMETFVKTMREEYGLKVSLWCGLAGVPPTLCDPSVCPDEARVIHADGRKADMLLCLVSPAFLDTLEKRLVELCRNGAAFLMFDSNQYSGPCFNETHGHQLPSTREDHANALLELTRRVKRRFPNVLIEMHDFITGPCGIHYTPTYYGYARPQSFDCLWGHEFMWSPMDDIASRRAVSLYYYNLAYSIPLYLHVNLKSDNQNALVFWWFASTCRHLGVGGKSSPPVWEAQKKAMKTYLANKRFFTQGVFYGLEETVHAHTLPDIRESVINVFNLENKPMVKTIRFRLAEAGLGAAVVGQSKKEILTADVNLPAHGHQLLHVSARPNEEPRVTTVATPVSAAELGKSVSAEKVAFLATSGDKAE